MIFKPSTWLELLSWLRPISLSRMTLGDIWKPASKKACGNDMWKRIKTSISILLSPSTLQVFFFYANNLVSSALSSYEWISEPLITVFKMTLACFWLFWWIGACIWGTNFALHDGCGWKRWQEWRWNPIIITTGDIWKNSNSRFACKNITSTSCVSSHELFTVVFTNIFSVLSR